jgi:predicted MPP superfamily phosphohydrolase
MVVSRGLGFEGGIAPRARFLCRPQIVSLTLLGTIKSKSF